jgi:hypothetical protein
VSPASF